MQSASQQHNDSTFQRLDQTITTLTSTRLETKHKWLKRLCSIKLTEAQAKLVIHTLEVQHAVR